MTDLLTDPRAIDLLSASPPDVAAMAQYLETAADEAGATAHGLGLAGQDTHWHGVAAEAFRASIRRIPAQLDRVRTGVHDVARTLRVYEGELSRIQSEYARTMSALADCEGRMGPAQSTAALARQALRQGARNRALTVKALIALELAAGRAQGGVGDLEDAIRHLSARAEMLLVEFAGARSAAAAGIAQASAQAPVPAPEWHLGPVSASGPIGDRPHRHGARTRRQTPDGGAGLGPGHRPPGHDRHGNSRHRAGPVPPAARRRIEEMTRTARSLLDTPYVWGGGHGSWGSRASGVDCSGFVSAVLHSAGYLNAPQTTEGFAGQMGIVAGHGHWVTIYDRTGCGDNEHVIIDINGTFYESGGGSASGGAPFVHRFAPSPAYLASFNTILHPAGL